MVWAASKDEVVMNGAARQMGRAVCVEGTVLCQNCFGKAVQNLEHAELKQQVQPHGVRKLLDLHIPLIFCGVDNY